MTNTLEEKIIETVQNKLNDGTVEKMAEKLAEEMIQKSLKEVFSGWSGGLGKIVEEKFKEVLTPIIENYNYSEHLVKLETVLDEVIQAAAKPQSDVLSAFSSLINVPLKSITFTELAKVYKQFVAENLETHDREIDYDLGEPEYAPVETSVSFEDVDSEYSWMNRSGRARIIFEVTDGVEDSELEKLNFSIPIWKLNEKWCVRDAGPVSIHTLRYLSEFEVLIRMLQQHYVEIEFDTKNDYDTVYSKTKPEYTLE